MQKLLSEFAIGESGTVVKVMGEGAIRGVSDKAFDGRGNYSVGLKEQLIFPEITYDQVDKIRGMDVAIVTTAKTDEEARELLRALGMPFKK